MGTCSKPISLVFLTCLAIGLPPATADDAGVLKGVVVDADDKKGIHDLVISVYELPGMTRVGGGSTNNGNYEITDLPLADRLSVHIYDPRFANADPPRRMYPPLEIPFLGAHQELHVLNIVLQNGAVHPQTNLEMRARVASLGRLLPTLEDRMWAAEYLHDVLSALRDDPTARFGAELLSATAAIQLPRHQILFGKDSVAAVSPDALHIFDIPVALNAPFSVTGGKTEDINLNWRFSSGLHGLLASIPSTRQGRIYHTIKWNLGDESPGIELDRRFGAVAVLSTDPSQQYVAAGGTEGTVNLSQVGNANSGRTFAVGQSPVTATAFSRDARLWTAVTIDGAYGIWEAVSGKNVRRGRIDGVFANSVTFSPDGQFLIVGTGLAKLDCAIVTVPIDRADEKYAVVRRNAAVTSVLFTNDGKTFLSAEADLTVTAWDFDFSESPHALKPFSTYTDVKSIGVPAKGNSVGIWTTGRIKPVLFPGKTLFDPKIDKIEFGIGTESPR